MAKAGLCGGATRFEPFGIIGTDQKREIDRPASAEELGFAGRVEGHGLALSAG